RDLRVPREQDPTRDPEKRDDGREHEACRQREHPRGRLRHQQQTPEEARRHAIPGADPQRDERQAPGHFSPPAGAEIVTVCTVGDAETPGTYIGATCAGIARKTPGVTTFSKYQRSIRPCDNVFWKNTTRLSLSSRRSLQRRGRCFSSGYRLSSAIGSVPAGSGSSTSK